MKGVELRAIFAKTHSATKIPTLFFYHSIIRFSLAEENRQLEKLNYRVGLVRLADTTAEFGVLTIHS